MLPSERAALLRRSKLSSPRIDSTPKDEILAGITAERESAIADAKDAAKNALTLTKPVSTPSSAPIVSSIFRAHLEKLDASGKSELAKIIEGLIEVAKSPSPKQIAAAELLIQYGYGKPKPSDEALDAMAKGGVQIVYIEAPHVPVGEERKELPARPDFIDANFEEINDER